MGGLVSYEESVHQSELVLAESIRDRGSVLVDRATKRP